MHMPGFTAEASLYESREPYDLTEGFAIATEGQTIVPQRIKLRTVHCNCDTQTDICVCDNGRVFHNVLGDL